MKGGATFQLLMRSLEADPTPPRQ